MMYLVNTPGALTCRGNPLGSEHWRRVNQLNRLQSLNKIVSGTWGLRP